MCVKLRSITVLERRYAARSGCKKLCSYGKHQVPDGGIPSEDSVGLPLRAKSKCFIPSHVKKLIGVDRLEAA